LGVAGDWAGERVRNDRHGDVLIGETEEKVLEAVDCAAVRRDRTPQRVAPGAGGRPSFDRGSAGEQAARAAAISAIRERRFIIVRQRHRGQSFAVAFLDQYIR
jgi:hypothetical protein